MKPIFIFLGGMFTGAIILYAALIMINFFSTRQMVREHLAQKYQELNAKPEVQYVDVTGKLGDATVHTGMEKDSVTLLLGKPDNANLRTVGSSTRETWSYEIKKDDNDNPYDNYKRINIDFENGYLENVTQY